MTTTQIKSQYSAVLAILLLACAVSLPVNAAKEKHQDHGEHGAVQVPNTGTEQDDPSNKKHEGGEKKTETPDSHKDDHGGHAEGNEGAHQEKSDGHKEHNETNEIRLSQDQLTAAGIVVEPVAHQSVPTTLSVPGEVKFSQYETQIVTPRIPAMILKRHVVMGATVSKGQSLTTLFSVEMAQAQGDFIVAKAEWERVKKLGRNVVSDKRLTEAKINFLQSKARLVAYGLTESQISSLDETFGTIKPGQFDLLAERDGIIASDDFQIGEMIEPGRAIYQLTDRSARWIEARVTPTEATLVHQGMEALVKVGDRRFNGKVLQLHQKFSEKTRTLGVRIGLDDPEQQLRPGQFVEVHLAGARRLNELAVPKDAVLRSVDGDNIVFRQTVSGAFVSQEIRVIREVPGLVVIEGIEPGTRVAVKGAFFLQSELAKSGFDIHNH